MTSYSREDEHKGRYSFKKGTGQYKRRQQGYTTAKERDVNKENYGQNHNIGKKSNDKRK